MSETADPDWVLFSDWCEAHDRQPLPASTETTRAFLADLRMSKAVQRRRIRSIADTHLSLGLLDPTPAARPDRDAPPVDPAPSAHAVIEMLGQRLIRSWPGGLFGRRDAFILLLRHTLGLTRTQIRELTAADLDVGDPQVGHLGAAGGQVSVRGVPVRRSGPAGNCDRCVITRWVRVLALLHAGQRDALRRRMSAQGPGMAVDETEHDCLRPLPARWQELETLIPAIDTHGWLVGQQPLSRRSLSMISSRHRMHEESATVDGETTPLDTGSGQRAPAELVPAERVPSLSRAEVAVIGDDIDEAFDRVERMLDEALSRSKQLLLP